MLKASKVLYFSSEFFYNIVMLKITDVVPHSVCDELEIKPGDGVLAFNGDPAEDILDYLFYNAMEFFTMSVETHEGEVVDFEIEKYPDEDLGLTFENNGELKPIRCQNKCVFCFVDQLPKGMRETLYFKDDDYRLSFVSGNFVTLTNLRQKDIDRIIRYRLSPLYVSVHTLNEELRCRMTNNRFAGRLKGYLDQLCANKIELSCQIVMVPGYNDGEELLKTLDGLYGYYPHIRDVAIVPVGLTSHREGLAELLPVTKEIALNTLRAVDAFNEEHAVAGPGVFAYCSDEFYVKAERESPPAEYYGEFTQIENGVGMLAKFRKEFEQRYKALKEHEHSRRIAFVTGVSAYQSMCDYARLLEKKLIGLKIDVIRIVNYYFGESITVAGLITAQDIVRQYRGEHDCLMLPKCMLKEFETVFLDGMSVEELAEKLNRKIVIVENDGAALIDAVLGEKHE